MPQTQVQLPDGTTHTYDFPDGATRAQIDEFLNAQHGATSVADRARASLAARGLTPEQVKQQAAIGVVPSNTPAAPVNADSPLVRFAHGAGLPTNMDEIKAMGEHLDPVNAVMHGDMAGLAGPAGIVARDAVKTIAGEAGDQAGQAADAIQHNEYSNYVKHSLGAAVPFVGPPVAEGDVAGGLGRAATLLVPEIADRAGARLAPKAADPLPITKVIGPGAYDTARGIDIGKTLIESGKPVDLAAIKEHPSRGLVDHFTSLLDHQNQLAEAKLSGSEGQTQIRASDLKAMAPKEVAEVGSTDARVRKAVNNWYQAAIDKATTPEGGVTIQDLDQIKRQLQGRTSYEKMFGNLNADPLRDATTADYARQLDHIGDEYVPGYKDINDRRAALSHTYKSAILPIADAYATTSAPSMIHGVGQMVGGAAALPIPGIGKGAGVARIARGAAEIVGRGSSTVDPMTVAKTINKQVARGQAAGMPGWYNEPIPTSGALESKPTISDQFRPVPPPPKPAPWGSQDAQNPGFDPDVHAVSQSSAPPPVPPTSIVDALRGNTVRIPGETTVQLPDSRGSGGPQQLNDTGMNRTPATESSQLPQQNPFLAVGADQPLPDINRHLDPAFTRPALPPMSGPGMQPSSGGTRFTGLPDGSTVDTRAAYDRLPDNHPAAPNPGFNPDQLPMKEPVLPTKRNMTIMDALRPAGQSAPAGEHAVSLTDSEGSGASGQLGGPAVGRLAIPNTTTTGTADHLTSVLTKPTVAESHASALSLSHPASLDPDVQAAILSGTAEYVDPRGRVIHIPAPDLLPH